MRNPLVNNGDHTVSNVITCLVLVMIESLQVLIILAVIANFFPQQMSPVVNTLFPRLRELVLPEREMFFYRVWVLMIMAGQAGLLYMFKDQLKERDLSKQWRSLLLVEAGWLLVMVYVIFKIWVYGWSINVLYTILAAAVLSKVFWKEITQSIGPMTQCLQGKAPLIKKGADVFVPLLIIALIAVTDIQGAVARMWIGDNLHHMDSTLMAQAWGYLKGSVLNRDMFAHYGLGMPIFMALLSKGLGGLSYVGVLTILITSTIAYFIGCYFFLRIWLQSVAIAVAGVLLAIKWQMFRPENYPFIFTYPYSTVCRYLFDIVFFFLLLVFIRRGGTHWLMAAGAVCGLSLFHVSDTGIYLTAALSFFLGWQIIDGLRHQREIWKDVLRPALLSIGSLGIVLIVLLYAFVGHFWSPQFWANMTEQIQLFLSGFGNFPMYKSLLEGDYLASLVGFVIPLIYGGVFLAVCSLLFLKRINKEHILIAVICVYGMGLYHYYVCRSSVTNYYAVCIPLVFVLCWLAHRWRWRAVLPLVATAALFTTHAFLSYPNVFNISSNPIVAPCVKWPNKNIPYYFNNISRSMPEQFKLPANSLGEQDEMLKIEPDFKNDEELKAYFSKEFDFDQDASLIKRLTSPKESVALISSFETAMLMRADRKSLFYYSPIIDSRPMRLRMFPFSSIHSTQSLSKTMEELEKNKPSYVFVERILMTRQVPKAYEMLYPELMYILSYLDKHYQTYAQGKYLVALKRI